MTKILLVEDDAFLAKMYVRKLSSEENFEVTTLTRGQNALDTVKKIKPDLILLDIILPDINGVKILQKLKEDAQLKNIAVIMLTNLNDRDYISESLALGADGYLIKAHFTPNEVVDKIKQVLRKHV